MSKSHAQMTHRAAKAKPSAHRTTKVTSHAKSAVAAKAVKAVKGKSADKPAQPKSEHASEKPQKQAKAAKPAASHSAAPVKKATPAAASKKAAPQTKAPAAKSTPKKEAKKTQAVSKSAATAKSATPQKSTTVKAATPAKVAKPKKPQAPQKATAQASAPKEATPPAESEKAPANKVAPATKVATKSVAVPVEPAATEPAPVRKLSLAFSQPEPAASHVVSGQVATHAGHAPLEGPNRAFRDDPLLDKRIIEGMLDDKEGFLDDMHSEGFSREAVIRRAAELGLSEALIRQVKGVAADLAGERPGKRPTPNSLGARTCLQCDRVFFSSGPGNRLCTRCRGGDAGLAQL